MLQPQIQTRETAGDMQRAPLRALRCHVHTGPLTWHISLPTSNARNAGQVSGRQWFLDPMKSSFQVRFASGSARPRNVDQTFLSMLRKSRFRDAYGVLGVKSSDEQRAIKKAYLMKAKELHPDMKGKSESNNNNSNNNENSEENDDFLLVAKAYEAVSTPEARAIYDAHLAQAGPGGVGGSSFRGIRTDIYRRYEATGEAGAHGFTGFTQGHGASDMWEFDEFGFPRRKAGRGANSAEDMYGEREAAKEGQGTAFGDVYGAGRRKGAPGSAEGESEFYPGRSGKDKYPMFSKEWCQLWWKESSSVIILAGMIVAAVIYFDSTREANTDIIAAQERQYFIANELALKANRRYISRQQMAQMVPKSNDE